jgi:hypothetical protein
MQIIFTIFIFCLVLFLYLHVQYHLKTSNDLEVYELEDETSKEKLEEILNIRQPVLLPVISSLHKKIMDTTNRTFLSTNYPAFEMKIRNSKEIESDTEMFVPLPLHATLKLVDNDTGATYFSENNTDFLQETGVVKHIQYNDEMMRPPMVSNCNYDVMFGSEGCITPFRYEINYRNFFLVTEGSIQIKLTPPKSSKYLHLERDYENFEFRSPANPWNPQVKFQADFDKIKCLDIKLQKGQMICIPAYWWYSIRFGKETSITCMRYRTYMNNIAIIPYVCMYALQIQNVKREVSKKANIETKSNESLEKTKTKDVIESTTTKLEEL